jgi:hypothetical protein
MKALKILLVLPVFVLVLCSCSSSKFQPPAYKALTPAVAKETFLYAAMSSSAYREQERQFQLGKIGWKKIDRNGQIKSDQASHSYTAGKFFGFGSGMVFDIWKKDGTEQVVFAFRGTDEPGDWVKANLAIPFSVPYKSARKNLRNFIADNPNCKVIALTGHSLGGGLALSCSVDQGIDAYVFDSSPRVFDGWGDRHKPAKRVSVHQKGEILEKARHRYLKFHEVVGIQYEADFPFGKTSRAKHSSYELAKHLVRMAAKYDSDAAAIQK